MNVAQPWEKQITSVWFTMIFLQLLLDSGSCLHCFHLIHLNNPLIFLLSVFYLIHTCRECLTSKQSPQRFTQQRVPTPLWGAHLQLMAWTDPRSVHNITLPLPPDLAPGDDRSERRTFKTNSGPDNSTPVQRGLGEQKHKDSTHNETHTKLVQYCMEGLQPNGVGFSLTPKEPTRLKLEKLFLFSQLIVWFSAKQKHEKSNNISKKEKYTFIEIMITFINPLDPKRVIFFKNFNRFWKKKTPVQNSLPTWLFLMNISNQLTNICNKYIIIVTKQKYIGKNSINCQCKNVIVSMFKFLYPLKCVQSCIF